MKNVLFIASEAVPFIKTGGLADVAGSLPKYFDKEKYDVRVMIPFKSDEHIAFEASISYMGDILKSGVKILQYQKGFIHAKTFLVDDLYATVGTVNLDYRSFYLHFECGVLIYNDKCIKDIKNDIEQTLNKSKIINKKDTKIDFIRAFKRAILKLFAPLM